MKNLKKKTFLLGVLLIASFVLWTVLLLFVDVKPIGPQGTSVGFSSMNSYVRNLTGVNMTLYVITDWLGLLPIAVALGFAVLGIVQWTWRKSFLKVDKSILALGVFYIAVISVYFFFEAIRVNYRPILIDGRLEASYPSSTATLTMCVMLSALLQLKLRVKNAGLRRIITFAISTFTAFTVIARIISGVHWISDIIGAVLFSTGAVMIYCSFSDDGSEDVILR